MLGTAVRAEDAGPDVVGGYHLTGPRYTVGLLGGSFVRRSTLPGRPWLRFIKRLDGDGYWSPAAYPTRAAAIKGDWA